MRRILRTLALLVLLAPLSASAFQFPRHYAMTGQMLESLGVPKATRALIQWGVLEPDLGDCLAFCYCPEWFNDIPDWILESCKPAGPELVQKLSLQTAKAINVALEESDLGAVDETRSLDAMLSYSEGLELLEQASYRAAYNKFVEALEYDPSYARAELKADSLRPMLN